jgi:hypothetical protein
MLALGGLIGCSGGPQPANKASAITTAKLRNKAVMAYDSKDACPLH